MNKFWRFHDNYFLFIVQMIPESPVYGAYLCIAHELRVKIVNFDINYLCIGTVEKFEINLACK